MSLFIRRLIFYLILILFFIAAPLIILYTAGYRYNFKQGKILKTGAIVISTDPKDAAIFLNNRQRPERTPARLLNLTPGEYNLHLEKEGYYNWEKKLRVESEQVTFANNLTLFKKKPPEIIAEGQILDCLLRGQEKNITYLKKEDGLFEIWLQEEKKEPILIWRGAFVEHPDLLEWLADNKILLKSKNSFFLLKVGNNQEPGELTALDNLTKRSWTKIKTNPSNNLLLGMSGNGLYSINLANGAVDLLAKEVTDFYSGEGKILFLEKQNKTLTLKSLKNGKETEIARFPGNQLNYEFREGAAPWIILYNNNNNELKLLSGNKSEDNVEEVVLPGEKTKWLENGNSKLISFSDFEVWSYEPKNKEKQLLVRLGEKINNLILHPSNNAFLIVTANNVKIYEMDLRDQQNIYNLASFDVIHQVRMDKTGKTLYVAGIKDIDSFVPTSLGRNEDTSSLRSSLVEIKNKEPGLWSLEIR